MNLQVLGLGFAGQPLNRALAEGGSGRTVTLLAAKIRGQVRGPNPEPARLYYRGLIIANTAILSPDFWGFLDLPGGIDGLFVRLPLHLSWPPLPSRCRRKPQAL